MDSPKGGPPRRRSRASSCAVRVMTDRPCGTWARSLGASSWPSTSIVPTSRSTPCSKVGSTSTSRLLPGASMISAPRSGVCTWTGEVAPSSEPMKTRASHPGPRTGSGAKCSKRGSTWRLSSGSAIQSWAPWSVVVLGRGDLGVADPATGGHQVELAGTHGGQAADGVTVLELAAEEPAGGLQPGVRVGREHHPAGLVDLVGAVVVDEAPGADQRAVALRERASYAHRPRTSQWDVTRSKHLDVGHRPPRYPQG